jgi:hypothetical protein
MEAACRMQKNDQFKGSGLVRDGRNISSAAQPAYRFSRTWPSAIVYPVPKFS